MVALVLKSGVWGPHNMSTETIPLMGKMYLFVHPHRYCTVILVIFMFQNSCGLFGIC